jgi:uncharacterized protein YndB with AHSA1/START domain
MFLRAFATLVIPRPPEQVFDFVTAPDAVARTFHGHGPIPGAVRSELIGEQSMRVGSIRRVHNSDGSIVDEEILELERPRAQAYRLVSGLRPPLSWLVRTAAGRWTFTAVPSGTRVDWTFDFVLRSPLLWPFVLPLRSPFQKAMSQALAKTRELLGAS